MDKNFDKIKDGPIVFLEMNFLMLYQLNNTREVKIHFMRDFILLIKNLKLKKLLKKS